jgi:hypothetical protein
MKFEELTTLDREILLSPQTVFDRLFQKLDREDQDRLPSLREVAAATKKITTRKAPERMESMACGPSIKEISINNTLQQVFDSLSFVDQLRALDILRTLAK